MSVNPPSIKVGESCYVSMEAMLKAFDKKYFEPPNINWDNHGVIMDYDPFTGKYLIECTGISAFEAAWIDPADFDRHRE